MKEFSLAFAPLAPLWLLRAVRRRGGGLGRRRAGPARARRAVLRAVVFAALLGALANPSLVEERREPLRDVVAVVLDRSASQDFGDRTRPDRRRARRARKRRLKELGDVEVRVIDAGATPATCEDGDGTRLFAALERGLADVAGRTARRRHHGDGRQRPRHSGFDRRRRFQGAAARA